MARPRRNAEMIRQWKVLQEIQCPAGKTVDELASACEVTTRTIRRDLHALEDAGFTLCNPDLLDGRVRWGLLTRPLRGLQETNFSVAELAALYFSRKLLECAADTPFQADLRTAFEKLEKAFSPRMKAFLNTLPQVLVAKPAPATRGAGDHRGLLDRLTRAVVEHHAATIRYHSFSSRRVKEYEIEPHRLVFAGGTFYLYAFVPAYGQMRTFAVQRIKNLAVLEERFQPAPATQGSPGSPAEGPFANSLGPYSGPPEHVEIEFDERVARYVVERTWHESQTIAKRPDGTIVLSLDVCLDRALSSWILSFGPFAHVVSPAKLAERILEEIEEARDVYAPRLQFSPVQAAIEDASSQHVLPFAKGSQPRASRRRGRAEQQMA